MTTMTRTETVTPQRNPARRRRSLTHPAGTGLALVAPALVFVAAFVFVPLGAAVFISLTNFPLIGDYHFVGLSNYTSVLTDAGFWRSVGYTLLYTAIVTLPLFAVGYLMAVLVRSPRRGAKLLRTLVFLPYVIGLSTLSFLVLLEAQPDSGLINVVLRGLHLSDGSTAWLVSGPLGTAVVCVFVVWAMPGLTMVLLMAGMQAIPREVYECAELDGAGWWRRERGITIPMLRRSIALCVIISVIGSFLSFTQFYILTQGGPGTATTTTVMAIYQRAFVQLQLGSATAMSLVLVVITALVTAIQFWLLRERD